MPGTGMAPGLASYDISASRPIMTSTAAAVASGSATAVAAAPETTKSLTLEELGLSGVGSKPTEQANAGYPSAANGSNDLVNAKVYLILFINYCK